ncbi:MAG: D-alanyl-D-alanine carboxypeptidase [Alphaproteobacteria bacterium]|nr:D-alanyl-D-alanine carboxypeptidase [Alphaproteobacteria bacterium]
MRIIFLSLLFLALPQYAFAASTVQETSAKQAVIVDVQTGQRLLDRQADARMPTSSMSKVMTIYMVFEALKNGRLKLDSELSVSEKAWRKGGSKMFVEVGKKVKVKDLIRGVIVQSGNDATIVLAEGLAGDEDAFARSLTTKAKELGMENSNFKNASGWPDPEHYSTAADLAILAGSMIENFPEYYKFYSEKEFTFNNIKQPNRNPLLYRDIGADGLKTGHTEAGGFGLMGSAKKDGRRVIMVINGLEDEKARAEEGARLIEWALNDFENKVLVAGAQALGQAKVAMGQDSEIALVTNEDVFLTIPKGAQDKIELELKYKEPVIAPVQKGDELGEVIINIPNMEPITYPLYAVAPVDKLGLIKGTFAKMSHFFANILK